MHKLEVFDPPMCCSTGVCGPSVDPKLVRFAADLEWLKSKGIEINRTNLAQEPGAFVHNLTLKKALNSHGMKCLPLLVLDGEIITTGGYPSREELARHAGVTFEPGPTFKAKQGDLVGISPSRHK
jgi:Arsenical resistance operon protein ArsD